MFSNIGRKIKVLAWVVCIIGMLASFVGAVRFWSMDSYYGDENILVGFVVLIVGGLISWVGSFFTYGFGQLIEKTEENNYHLNQIGHMLYEMKNHK